MDEILAELYSENRQANKETAEEIVKRLEAQKNYIPPSDRIRKEYAFVLLKEYREYVASQAGNNPKQNVRPKMGQDGHGKKGLL